jgi:hypothetical protein
MLAGSASADLFKNTLSRIPTLFGRLTYLASLRDSNSGVYNHHGLGAIFGRDESRRALGEAHTQIFQLWLNLPLAAKQEDLVEYLTSVEDPPAAVVAYWAKAGVSRGYIPRSAGEAEQELFLQEFALLVELLKC